MKKLILLALLCLAPSVAMANGASLAPPYGMVMSPDAVVASGKSVVEPKLADYTLNETSDCNAYFRMGKATAQTITIPPDSTLNCPDYSEITFEQSGAGELTIVEGSGVTINKVSTLVIAAQHGTAAIKKVGANEWTIAGYLN